MEVAVAAVVFFLHGGDLDDVVVFCFSLELAGVAGAAEALEDVLRFVEAADFGEPAWRFGKEVADNEEEEEGDDLEGDGEAPCEAG